VEDAIPGGDKREGVATGEVGPTDGVEGGHRRRDGAHGAHTAARVTRLACSSARERAPERQPCFHFGVQLFDRSKLKKFELNLKISKYKSWRTHYLLQLSQRVTYGIFQGLAGKSTQTSVFSRPGQHGVVNFD
jgi:hypothetical protein